MAKENPKISLFTPKFSLAKPNDYEVIQTLPPIVRKIPFRFIKKFARSRQEHILAERCAREPLCGGKIAYLWPGTSLSLPKSLRESGATIVAEMTNCHMGTAREILDTEYKRIGLPSAHGISQSFAEQESESLSLCDYVFCPNGMVEKSVIDHGIPKEKILPASYGWDPRRFKGITKHLARIDGVTVLFVGRVCIGKGAHLLLDYWARSGVRGRLVLVGTMEPALARKYAHFLARDDVKVIGYTDDIASLYRSADIFAFPSLVEGGPQVTYEAAGCQLPLITSPMGAARIARHGATGFVIDPFDANGWIEAIRALSASANLREQMARAAYELAQDFTWEAVGFERARQLRAIAIKRANNKRALSEFDSKILR
jgi:glycosyltransferase involved in cell wall biosynthesis